MSTKPNHEQRAYHAWNALVEAAGRREILRYRQLGDRIGIHHRAVGHALDPIHRYCIRDRLPPLTILVVNETGLPGSGFLKGPLAPPAPSGPSPTPARRWTLRAGVASGRDGDVKWRLSLA